MAHITRGIAPINGCMTRPERGPATNTTAILDFDRPRDKRYGEADKGMSFNITVSAEEYHNAPYDISTLQNICIPSNPTVRVGRCDHWGPTILESPLNF